MHSEQIGAALRGKRVLIVEDEVSIAMLIEGEVLDAGALVVGPAFDLQSALQFAVQPLDAAVLDINLRGEKVFAAARILRDRGVPFIFASANCDDIDSTGFEFDGYPRLDKPFTTGRLLELLNSAVFKFSRGPG